MVVRPIQTERATSKLYPVHDPVDVGRDPGVDAGEVGHATGSRPERDQPEQHEPIAARDGLVHQRTARISLAGVHVLLALDAHLVTGHDDRLAGVDRVAGVRGGALGRVHDRQPEPLQGRARGVASCKETLITDFDGFYPVIKLTIACRPPAGDDPGLAGQIPAVARVLVHGQTERTQDVVRLGRLLQLHQGNVVRVLGRVVVLVRDESLDRKVLVARAAPGIRYGVALEVPQPDADSVKRKANG